MSAGYVYECWPNTNMVKSWTGIGDEADTPEGWIFLALADGPPPDPVPSPAQQEAAIYALLDSKQRQATLQISAIQSRIDAINDAVELDEALPAEVAELPVRTAQLKVWKKYRIDLGRVSTIAGWPTSPTWPAVPEAYNSETAAVSPSEV